MKSFVRYNRLGLTFFHNRSKFQKGFVQNEVNHSEDNDSTDKDIKDNDCERNGNKYNNNK